MIEVETEVEARLYVERDMVEAEATPLADPVTKATRFAVGILFPVWGTVYFSPSRDE